MIARMFFIIIPAIILGGLLSIIHPAVGLVFAACVAGIGIEVTAPRYERGEEPPPWPLVRRIKSYDLIPHGWGIAWLEDYRNVRVVMPMPLNLVASYVRTATDWVKGEVPEALDDLRLRWEARRDVRLAALLTLERQEVSDAEQIALDWLRQQNPGRFRAPGDMESVIRSLLREVTQGQVAHARADMLEDRLRQVLAEPRHFDPQELRAVLEFAQAAAQGIRGDIHYLCGALLRRLNNEAAYTAPGMDAARAIESLAGMRVFITTREKIKAPEGVDLFDEAITVLRAHVAGAVSLVAAREVFRIAGGDVECSPNPTTQQALDCLQDLRSCYDEAIAARPAGTVEDRAKRLLSEDPALYVHIRGPIDQFGCRVAEGPAAAALYGKYGDVLRPFVMAMERELHANAGKGDRPGWLTMSPQFALLEIYYHLAKLQKAVKDDNGPGIQEYAADVANMSMMLLDICGGLALIEPVAAGPEAGDG